jgi:hypothetical protein
MVCNYTQREAAPMQFVNALKLSSGKPRISTERLRLDSAFQLSRVKLNLI